tara:strand:- start:19 stop:177 length:159 start_codon:yes stop_codon:yes gene_type:complete
MSLRVAILSKSHLAAVTAGLLFTLTLTSCGVAETFNNTNTESLPKGLGDVIE